MTWGLGQKQAMFGSLFMSQTGSNMKRHEPRVLERPAQTWTLSYIIWRFPEIGVPLNHHPF